MSIANHRVTNQERIDQGIPNHAIPNQNMVDHGINNQGTGDQGVLCYQAFEDGVPRYPQAIFLTTVSGEG